jgi:amidase
VRTDQLGLAGLGAVELAGMLADKEVSAREVLVDHLRVIDEQNAGLNAICTLAGDLALAEAERADASIAAGRLLGPLHGIPIVHKDVLDTEGLRTTYGSLTHRDHVPTTDAAVVRRCRSAGAVLVGKTNTPQFATGGHTSNRVFGTTRNPLDQTRTAGGSSGGSAAALAAHMAPLATGTDMAGSLRVPSAFCGTVGMRPSLGQVPLGTSGTANLGLTVAGPMARSVADLALLFSVLASRDVDPSLLPPAPLRVAWCPRPGGVSVEPELAQVLAQVPTLLSDSCIVEEAEPHLPEARVCFETLRGREYARAYGHLLTEAPELLDPLVRANIEKGSTYSDDDVARAERERAQLVGRAEQFFTGYDVLVAAGSVVWPFPAEQWTPDGGEGRQGTAYLDWLEPYVRFSVLGAPVVLLPVGRTPSGVPVSVQLVAAPGRDLELLAIATFLDSVLRASSLNAA